MPKVTVDIDARNNTQKAFNAVQRSTEKLQKSFFGLKAGIAALVDIGGLGAMAKALLSAGDQLAKIEANAVSCIEAAAPITASTVPLAEARQAGAMMLFGDAKKMTEKKVQALG